MFRVFLFEVLQQFICFNHPFLLFAHFNFLRANSDANLLFSHILLDTGLQKHESLFKREDQSFIITITTWHQPNLIQIVEGKQILDNGHVPNVGRVKGTSVQSHSLNCVVEHWHSKRFILLFFANILGQISDSWEKK